MEAAPVTPVSVSLRVNGRAAAALPGEPLVDLLGRLGLGVPHVCYHPALGPLQTCCAGPSTPTERTRPSSTPRRSTSPRARRGSNPLAWTEPSDQPDDEYDLNNGRVLEHYHEGNMTYRVPGIAAKVPDAWVEVSTALAAERGLEDGDWVRLVSRRGAVKLRVLVSEQVRGGELYVPEIDTAAPINMLTSNVVDPDSSTPAYKEIAVRLEKLGHNGGRPLPKTYHRYGSPTPQAGVEVERKWARADYVFPTRDRPPGGHV